MRRCACVFLCALLASPKTDAQNLTPVGVWLDKSRRIEVEITPCDDQLCGNLVWFKWPNDAEGLPLVDLKNEDPSLRQRPLSGLSILYGLRRTGENTWGGGEIYDPQYGKSYHVQMTVQDEDTLSVRGYEFSPIFGETHIWTRVR